MWRPSDQNGAFTVYGITPGFIRWSFTASNSPLSLSLRGKVDGRVSFGGHWVRIGYLASASSPVVVTAGQASYSTVIQPGVHALYVAAGDDFDSVEISGLASGVTMCTDDVVAGIPEPATGEEAP